MLEVAADDSEEPSAPRARAIGIVSGSPPVVGFRQLAQVITTNLVACVVARYFAGSQIFQLSA